MLPEVYLILEKDGHKKKLFLGDVVDVSRQYCESLHCIASHHGVKIRCVIEQSLSEVSETYIENLVGFELAELAAEARGSRRQDDACDPPSQPATTAAP